MMEVYVLSRNPKKIYTNYFCSFCVIGNVCGITAVASDVDGGDSGRK